MRDIDNDFVCGPLRSREARSGTELDTIQSRSLIGVLLVTQRNYRAARGQASEHFYILRFPTGRTCAVPALAYGCSLRAPIGVLLS